MGRSPDGGGENRARQERATTGQAGDGERRQRSLGTRNLRSTLGVRRGLVTALVIAPSALPAGDG
jgi:hypothetical protein